MCKEGFTGRDCSQERKYCVETMELHNQCKFYKDKLMSHHDKNSPLGRMQVESGGITRTCDYTFGACKKPLLPKSACRELWQVRAAESCLIVRERRYLDPTYNDIILAWRNVNTFMKFYMRKYERTCDITNQLCDPSKI